MWFLFACLFLFASAFRSFCPFYSNALDDRQCFIPRSAMRKKKDFRDEDWQVLEDYDGSLEYYDYEDEGRTHRR